MMWMGTGMDTYIDVRMHELWMGMYTSEFGWLDIWTKVLSSDGECEERRGQ